MPCAGNNRRANNMKKYKITFVLNRQVCTTEIEAKNEDQAVFDFIASSGLSPDCINNTEEITAPPRKITFTQIDNDGNGNPRYVVHFYEFIGDADAGSTGLYELAIKRAKKLGGRKYHTRRYGGGIVFQSCNTADLQRQIFALVDALPKP